MKKPLILILLFCTLGLSMLAQAQHFDERNFPGNQPAYEGLPNNHYIDRHNDATRQPWQIAREPDYISKAQAVDIARQSTNGKVLSVQLVQKNQHSFYKIKVLTESGRIKTLRINAQAN